MSFFTSASVRLALLMLLHFCAMQIASVHRRGGASSWKSSSDIGVCQHLFRPSKREMARQDQKDPLLLWLGRPSQALQVEGKFGPIPMPTVWVSFVNVLYINDCVEWSGEHIIQFLQLWFMQSDHVHMTDRDLYIAGNLEDDQGGMFLFEIASLLHKVYRIAGIVAANSRHTPVMRFTAHRSFETNNNMTDWTVNRARQDITCNGYYSEVEFLMHDVHLHYRPKVTSSTVADNRHTHYEYELVVASTPDLCYSDMDVFESEWSTRKLPRGTTTHPRLQSTRKLTSAGWSDSDGEVMEDELFPMCGDQHSSSRSSSSTLDTGKYQLPHDSHDAENEHKEGDTTLPETLTHLLESNVKIVLYSYLQKSSQAICNFYIGIYESDSSKFHVKVKGNNNNGDHQLYSAQVSMMLEQFNHATLEEMSAVWTSGATSGATIAWLQDGLEFELPADAFSPPPAISDSRSEDSLSGSEHDGEAVQEEQEQQEVGARAAYGSGSSRDSGGDRDTEEASTSSKGGLVWMQLDDRYVPDTSQNSNSNSKSNSKQPLFGYLTKATAVEILAHVLGKHQSSESEGEGGRRGGGAGSVIDFVDLFV